MRRYLFQSCYFILGLMGCFLLLEVPIQWNYAIQNSDMGDWQTLADINADILLVGNSRTWTTFDTESMSNELGVSVYALAQDGWNCHLLGPKLNHYLRKNRPPSVIFIQVDPTILSRGTSWYDKPHFLKYIWLDRERLWNTMRGYEGNHWWEWGIPFVRYLGYPRVYLRDALGQQDPLNRVMGSWPNPSGVNTPLEDLPISIWSPTTASLDCMETAYNCSPESKIYFLIPPISRSLAEVSEFGSIYSEANRLSAELVDLSEYNLPDSCFRNHTHVNRLGSQWTTDSLTKIIQNTEPHALQQP